MKLKIAIAGLFTLIVCFLYIQNSNKEKTFDPRNSSYEIEGKTFVLKDGLSEVEVLPGSAPKIITRYFGNEAKGDLNNDGLEDMVFLVTQDRGGTGLFYYAVVALGTSTGHKVSNAFFIGDRIAPQNNMINSSAQELYINYAERKSGEPMTVQPSVGAVKILRITFEGRLVGLMQ